MSRRHAGRARGLSLLFCALATGCGGSARNAERSAAVDGGALGIRRPAYNTGKGFFVEGSRIYDANGVEFLIRGINHTHWWGQNDMRAIPFIANANPNTVRAVFGDGMGATTPDAKRAVAQAYVDQKIVPVVEYHSGTCQTDPSYLQTIVDMWTDPANVAWLNALERYTILNIANEWGPDTVGWRDAYVAQIPRLRAAGIKNLLLVDAGQCGQVAETITSFAQAILDADPEKNVAFSIHMYSYWVDPGDPSAGSWTGLQPYDMQKELDALTATGLPLVVGEFSWQASTSVPYTTRPAIELYDAHHLGWIAWSWNQNSDPLLDMAVDYQYVTDADLTDFGKLIVTDPELGLKAKAVRATVFP